MNVERAVRRWPTDIDPLVADDLHCSLLRLYPGVHKATECSQSAVGSDKGFGKEHRRVLDADLEEDVVPKFKPESICAALRAAAAHAAPAAAPSATTTGARGAAGKGCNDAPSCGHCCCRALWAWAGGYGASLPRAGAQSVSTGKNIVRWGATWTGRASSGDASRQQLSSRRIQGCSEQVNCCNEARRADRFRIPRLNERDPAPGGARGLS